MKIYGVQIDSVWENKAANHRKVSALLDQAQPEAGSLVVLGEMFATGFSMNVEDIHDSDTHETQDFLAQTAAEREIFLLGGVVTKDVSGLGRNESVVYSPKGVEIARYCKLQPFTLGGEKANYVAGEDICLFNWQGFKVASFICYDLRFPELFRAAASRGAELIAVIASWPAVREEHWVSLLKARAIENQAYVIGINRCGNDPKLYHSGGSSIFDPAGKLLKDTGARESWIEAEIDQEFLSTYRNSLPFLNDIREDFVKFG